MRNTLPRCFCLSALTLIMSLGLVGCYAPALVFDKEPLDTSVQSYMQEVDVEGDGDRVRFLVVGDAGVQSEPGVAHPNVRAVVTASKAVCEGGGCDFALFAGDNVYPSGVDSAESRAFFDDFVAMYAFAGPQYYVLGNHDWGWQGIVHNVDRARAELEAIAELEAAGREVYGRAHFFEFNARPARIWGLDTMYMVVRCEVGLECLEGGLDKRLMGIRRDRESPWKIAFGHHPYWSSGQHRDTGRYDHPFYRGGGFKEIMDRFVLGEADLYISGHDHDMQFYHRSRSLSPLGQTGLLVSGGGGKCRPRTPLLYEGDYYSSGHLGFSIVEADRTSLRVDIYHVLIDGGGAVSYWRAFSARRVRGEAGWKVLEVDDRTVETGERVEVPGDRKGCGEGGGR